MKNHGRIIFESLQDDEKKRKLALLSKQEDSICRIWKKGDKNREHFDVQIYLPDDLNLVLKKVKKKPTFENGTYCMNFQVGGVNYFYQGSLKKNLNDSSYSMNMKNELYKSERRESFRLLTYPTFRVRSHIKLKEDEYEGSNVIDFKKRVSETNIFKNFLDVVNNKKKYKDHKHFRVQDISVSGLCLQVGKIENDLFEKDQFIENLILEFEGIDIFIPTSRVAYKIPYIQSERNNLPIFKVGIEFLKIDEETEKVLSQKIHEVLREFNEDSDFEDFVK